MQRLCFDLSRHQGVRRRLGRLLAQPRPNSHSVGSQVLYGITEVLCVRDGINRHYRHHEAHKCCNLRHDGLRHEGGLRRRRHARRQLRQFED